MTSQTRHVWGVALLAALGVLGAASVAEAQGGPFSFFSLLPCRIVDTRGPAGPTGGPKLSANTQRSFPTKSLCGVPTTAQAVVYNVTIAEPTNIGDIRIAPAGTPVPLASVINWVATDLAVANGAIIPLGDDGIGNHVTVQVDMPIGQVHLVLDVTGYFQ